MDFWKEIEGYNGDYLISNTGKVISTLKGEEMELAKATCHGYFTVNLYKNRKKTTVKVHRLVASHFVFNEYNKDCVNHLDGDKKNNHAINLEWVTQKENSTHAASIGLYKPMYGESNPGSKLRISEVKEIIHLLSKGAVQRELAQKYKVSCATICMINKGKIWAKTEMQTSLHQ